MAPNDPNAGRSLPPDLGSVSGLAHEGRRWTPIGIIGSLTICAVVIVGVLGGRAGVQELIGASEATQREIRASEARILIALEKHADIERKARAQLQAMDGVHEKRQERLAEAFSKLNAGRPNKTWPVPREGTWTPPRARQPAALSGWTTDSTWPANPDTNLP